MILGKLVDWLTTPELRDQFMVNVGLTGQLASSKPNPIALYTIKGGLGGKTSLINAASTGSTSVSIYAPRSRFPVLLVT